MNVAIANRQRVKKINARFLKQVTLAALAELSVTEGELGIHLVGPVEMAKVNWQFLQHEGSTDVITFDHADVAASRQSAAKSSVKNCGSLPRCRYNLNGELFICVADAIKQAKEFKTTWQSEVIRYVAHGILHLLGYDDLKPHLRRVMKREENRLVRVLAKKFSFTQLARPAKLKA